MSHVIFGDKAKFTLLWPHPSLCPTILPPFGHPREPIKVLEEGGSDRLPNGARLGRGLSISCLHPGEGLLGTCGVGVKVKMMAVIFRSWGGAALVLRLRVLGRRQLSQPCWLLSPPSLPGQQGSHPSLLLLKPQAPHSLWRPVLRPASNFISLTPQRAEDSGGFPETSAQAPALLGPREWALLLSRLSSAWSLLAPSGNSCLLRTVRLKFMGHVPVQR